LKYLEIILFVLTNNSVNMKLSVTVLGIITLLEEFSAWVFLKPEVHLYLTFYYLKSRF